MTMAKLGSPEMVGRFALGLAITAPVFMLANLNLASIQATDARNEYQFCEYLGLRVVSSVLALLLVLLVVLLGGYGPQVGAIVLLIGVAKAVESLSDMVYGVLQKHERMDLIASSLIVKGAVSLLVVAAALYVTGSLAVAILGLIVVWWLVMTFFDRRNAARFTSVTPVFARRALFSLTWLALPLGFVAGLNSFTQELPRYFLERSFGERELGLFAAVASLAASGRMVSMALSRSAAPRLSRHYAAGERKQFARLLWKLVGAGMLVGTAGVVGALLCGRWFLTVFYRPEYAERTSVLVWIMAGAGAVTAGTFLGTALTAARVFRTQAAIHVGKAVLAGLLCFVLVPPLGSLGAAWALLGVSLFSVLAYVWVMYRVLFRGHVREATSGVVTG